MGSLVLQTIEIGRIDLARDGKFLELVSVESVRAVFDVHEGSVELVLAIERSF